MTNLKLYTNAAAVARVAAQATVEALRRSLSEREIATWVLAGGSSPMLAYEILANEYAGALDWSRVAVLIGDERIVPSDHPDSNWRQTAQVLFARDEFQKMRQLIPDTTKNAEEAARDYESQLTVLFAGAEPHFDVVWFGMGEDGHTLSLFPDKADYAADHLVVPVHDAPKPPSERITLTIHALRNVDTALIFATGFAKQEALHHALAGENLPIRIVAEHIASRGGDVRWLVDEAARGITS